MQDKAIPTRVVASAATGIATSEPYNCVPGTEDTITLLVDWQSVTSPRHKGTAVYTASWTAPLRSGVHSAQHWYYVGEKVSPISLIQALEKKEQLSRRVTSTLTRHTGDTMSPSMTPARPGITRSSAWTLLIISASRFMLTIGFLEIARLLSMKYSPSESGHFDGQRGYGYISIEKFVDAVRSVNAGTAQPTEFDAQGLPTITNTVLTTAILNAGRISLDEKRPVGITKEGARWILH